MASHYQKEGNGTTDITDISGFLVMGRGKGQGQITCGWPACGATHIGRDRGDERSFR